MAVQQRLLKGNALRLRADSQCACRDAACSGRLGLIGFQVRTARPTSTWRRPRLSRVGASWSCYVYASGFLDSEAVGALEVGGSSSSLPSIPSRSALDD